MIARIWHGYTTAENADMYQKILHSHVIPGIERMKLNGFRKITVLRRELTDEVEFVTIMHFDSLEHIKEFTGEDYKTAHVPEQAHKVLKRFDETSQHYEIIKSTNY